ncbi:hypothetical protein KML001_39240 [Klebsiella quasipneumoniae subsp. similipneumoniae]|nr:hypothetical protein KML001_39240 [Klebsiella quasipneumoniae subsp. similipneumoniae]
MLFVFWATSRTVEVWFIFLCIKKEVLRDVANNRVAAIAILKLVIEQRIISCFVS